MFAPDRLPPAFCDQRQIPAWLLSLALHLAILVAGALVVRGTPLPGKEGESVRAGGIVLTQANQAAPQRYFSEEDDSPSSVAAADGTDSIATEPAANFDPSASLVTLPQGSSTSPGSELLVVRPSPQAGRGKGRFGRMSAEDVAAILAEEAARTKPVGPTGPKAKFSLFGSAEAEGRSFVFLIDRSQSMGHGGLGAIAAAAKELAASIDQLGPEQKFQVIAYNQKPDSLGGKVLLAATDENKRRLVEFVAGIVAFGATEHEMGLFAALRFKPDVIFLLTDAGDPGLKPGHLRAIREAAAGRTVIHCLHFGEGPASSEKSFMQRLAEENGGSYVYIDMRERE